jgi:hypothetical protein
MPKPEVTYVGTCPHGNVQFFAVEDHSDKSYSRQIEKENAVKSETVSPASAEYHSGEVDFMTQYSLTDAEMEEANKFLAQHGYASPKLIATTMLAAYASHVSSLSSQAWRSGEGSSRQDFLQ